MNANILKTEAIAKLRAFLANPTIAGLFRQSYERLAAAGTGVDLDLRREATSANAQALLWIATNR